jgi:hypothetical protein
MLAREKELAPRLAVANVLTRPRSGICPYSPEMMASEDSGSGAGWWQIRAARLIHPQLVWQQKCALPSHPGDAALAG